MNGTFNVFIYGWNSLSEKLIFDGCRLRYRQESDEEIEFLTPSFFEND
jgi:hypothetical protein